MMTTAEKTPGYNCRLAVYFTTNAQGKRMAWRWSHQQCRAFRMGLAEAENLVAQGLVDTLPGHPLKEAEKVEEDLTWEQVEAFDKEDPEHLNALATMIIQAGRDAYAVDCEPLMPKHGRCDLKAREDAEPLWERGKGFAASFMAREKRLGHYSKNSSAWMDIYRAIYIWWAYGYDHARRGE